MCKPCPNAGKTNPARTACLCADNKQIFSVATFNCVNLPVNSSPNSDFSDFVCFPGYNKVGNTCVNSCTSGAVPDTQGQCLCTGGLYLDPSTKTCTKPLACPPSSTWNTSTLQCACNSPGQYMSNGQCTTCPALSVYSPTQQQCICNTGYFNIGGVCTVCDPRTRFTGTDCVCQLGYYGTRDKCEKCHASCSICSGP